MNILIAAVNLLKKFLTGRDPVKWLAKLILFFDMTKSFEIMSAWST